MLKNYFTVAWRNLLKSKAYSAINIIGLATGMAVAILIALWIWDELSFNHYHSNHQQLAQVMTTQTFNGETGTGQAVAMPLGEQPAGRVGGHAPAGPVLAGAQEVDRLAGPADPEVLEREQHVDRRAVVDAHHVVLYEIGRLCD